MKYLILSLCVMCSSCSAKQQPSVSKVTPNKSVKVANIKPIKTKEIKDEDVVVVPNQFPLKDGKLEQQKKEKEKTSEEKQTN